MKNSIGLILFGLLLRYGSADVSHLAKAQHSQYLPPVNQNLPIEQDYNGLDSHQNNGYLPPDNDNQNENRGYLPPYKGHNQHQHNHHDHHDHHDNAYGHHDHHDHGDHNDHHDHSQNHHHDQQHQHDHHGHSQSYHNDQQHQHGHQHHHDDHHHNPNVQVSYHNDYALNQQHDQHHAHNDHSHGHNNNQDHYDNSHHDYDDIDQQQLDPAFPSSLADPSYLPPATRSHQNSVHNNPQPFTPAHGTSQQVSPSPNNGYDYSPPAIQPTESLYPNQIGHTNNRGPVVADGHQHTHQGSPQTNHAGHHGGSNQGYLPPSQSSHRNPEALRHTTPINSNQGHHGGSNQGYLPPSHSSGHSHQEPHQDYLPPAQLNHANPTSAQQEYHPPTHGSHQDYLPPNQENQVSHLNHAGPGESQVRGYLPPTQPTHQGNIHRNLGNQVSHLNHAIRPTEQANHVNGYLPPSHEDHAPHSNHVHSQQEPSQDYLPPSHSNHATSGNLPFLDDHTGHTHQESPHLAQNRVPSQDLPFLDDLSDHVQQEPRQNYFNPTQSGHTHNSGRQEPQQDYLPPTSSNSGNHANNGVTLHTHSGQNRKANAVDLPDSSDALHVVPPPQLGSSQHDDESEPRSKLTVRGHINVPLPIPQVGYFFLPGTVSKIPSLNAGKSEGLRLALNIPSIIGPQTAQAYQQSTPFSSTHRISSPEYKGAFLLPNNNLPTEKRSSDFMIIPSIQTQRDQQAQHNPQNSGQNFFSNLPFLPQSNLQSLPQQNQNLNNGEGYQREDRQFVSPDNLPNHGLSLQNIARSQVTTEQTHISQPLGRIQSQGSDYLPPSSHHHNHQHDHSYNRAQPQIQQQTHYDQNTNADRGYLPPESHNQMTSLQTYMSAVDPSDRYGSSQYHNPPPKQKGAPSPPIATSPPMYNKPSAVVSYAPGMAYKVSTNTPFNTLTTAAYLPAVESAVPQQDHYHDHSSLNIGLNEAAKKNLAKIMPKDNTVFPLEELLDIHDDDDINLTQLMDQLRGRVRTVQIINNHANSVKNIKVLETADQDGVKTIKILGPSNEDPMGDHKIVHIVSKGSNPEGIRQTVKIFSDHKEVTIPTQNGYLPPPPTTNDSKVRVLRRSKESFRRH